MSRLRIVGGQWRSRQLSVAQVPGLRPTPDRVRETVFNWLGQDLTGWRCLDLFAGTGAMGLEAASRGAAQVDLVELDPRAFVVLQQHVKALNATQVGVFRGDAVKFAASVRQAYDLVFLDPPYHKGWLTRVEPMISHLLRPDGWIYVEAETPVESLADCDVERSGKVGQVCYQLMRRRAE
ncbi:MAG: 16S rRNA (guanine(966)-N(2))-methyltransferase RsmD [Denitromonas halophila]|nr:MAG: 16S rRNA (guanine(966)-N(2))-methyltransferase RsmD [Denitromonas halophila]